MSGEARSSMFCLPYIYESFIDLGNEYQVDVYIHSWKNFRAIPLYNPKKFKIDQRAYNELRVKVQESFEFHPYGESVFFYNHNLMYYGIQECFNLIDEKYDVYIKCRPDLIFESKAVLGPIFYDIINDKYDLFSLHSVHPTKVNNGVDDQVYICNYKTMNIISKYFYLMHENPKEHVKEYLEYFKGFNAEFYLSKYLKLNKIRVNHNPLSNYRLVRYVDATFDGKFNFLDQ